ncbi:toxin Cry1Ac domain D-VI-related protein [Breznakia pachnodae]|uniref:Pesticidal crystal protein Cry1Aa domain-containing protein n=1 Tax=Breznakia pachnodae TaxID=265178 RepID=A0ABU0E221_9FIRM|nr:toxin Cry1Ac domain D-VI-related protein [Breznakia pachnodae]MDQ0360937.1 hypothetical protein [Breznakia pachnodae]
MKSKYNKRILLGLLAVVMLFSLGRNVISADDALEGMQDTEEVETIEEIEETEQQEEIVEVEDTLSTEEETTRDDKVELQRASIVATSSTELVAGVTTLGEAFPDANFRTYVAENILLMTSGSYDETTLLTTANITTINTTTNVSPIEREIESLEGIKYFTNVATINCRNNKLTELDVSGLQKLQTLTASTNNLTSLNIANTPMLRGMNVAINELTEVDIPSTTSANFTTINVGVNKLQSLDVSAQLSLQSIDVSFNYITELDVSNTDALTTVILTSNPITSIDISSTSQASITRFQYELTSIPTMDLSGFSSLVNLGVTKSTNADLSDVINFRVSGSKAYNQREYTQINVTAGSLSIEPTYGYYVAAADTTGTYKFVVNIDELDRRAIAEEYELTEGALVDLEGNIIRGADTSNIKSDGSIVLETGGTILSGGGIYTFSGKVTVKDGIISTEDDYTFAKNTGTYDPVTGTSTATVGDIETVVSVNGGAASIDTNIDEATLPAGTIVTDDNGNVTYMPEGGSVDAKGNVTSDERVLTVPSDKVIDITTDSDGKAILPEGTIVSESGTDVTYPGKIEYNPDDNSVKYLPVDDLFKDDGTITDELTQKDIDEAQLVVDSMTESTLKDELQEKIDEAQRQLDEREAEKAVEDLFKPDSNGEIKDDLTQNDIDNAQDLVNKLPNGDKKDELQDKINEAQKQLDEKLYVIIEHFAVFKGTGTVYTKIDAPVEKFSKVYVDGKELDVNNYEVTSGSTVITLKEAYLKTLANGDYKVEVEFVSGAKVNTTLTVDVKSNASKTPTPGTSTTSKPSVDTTTSSSTNSSNVNTGDDTDTLLLIGMLVVSLARFAVVYKRKETE